MSTLNATPNRFCSHLCVLLLLFGTQCLANTDGTLGLSFNQVIDDLNWGVYGDATHTHEPLTTSFDGTFQSGDLYRGDMDLAVQFDVSKIGVKLFSNNHIKGYTLGTLGRTNDIGAALVVPMETADIAIGIFGRNGNPFGAPSALDVLKTEGFSEDSFDGYPLADIPQPQQGLTIEGGNSLNASLETDFEVNRFAIELKALLELFGDGYKTHQILSDIRTSGTLMDNVDWNAVVDLRLQFANDIIEYETAWILGVSYDF